MTESDEIDLKIEIDPQREIITIGGIRYAFALFSALAFAPMGSEFQIIQRADGVVTLHQKFVR